eukprot:718232-Pelagomonas_calceolata.AAC.2
MRVSASQASFPSCNQGKGKCSRGDGRFCGARRDSLLGSMWRSVESHVAAIRGTSSSTAEKSPKYTSWAKWWTGWCAARSPTATPCACRCIQKVCVCVRACVLACVCVCARVC